MASKEIPTYELYIKDIDTQGLVAMGLVEEPAIEQDFVFFNKQNLNKYEMAQSFENKIVGPALIPNKKIIRQDQFGSLYNVNFSVDLVKELAHNFLKESKQHLTTEQHDHPINGVFMIESWIVENEQDKIYTKYNYDINNVKLGSWCIMYQVENQNVINKIKDKKIKGFSIEAYLSEKIVYKSQFEKLIDCVKNFEDKEKIIQILKKVNK